MNMKGQSHMKRRPYLLDPRLIPRITAYLDANMEKKYIDIDHIVTSLRKRHVEYRRLKHSSFRNSVERAYSVLQNKTESILTDESLSSEASESESENEGLNEVLQDIKNGHMNQKMEELYQDGASTAPEMKLEEEKEVIVLSDSAKGGSGGIKRKNSQGFYNTSHKTKRPKQGGSEGMVKLKPSGNKSRNKVIEAVYPSVTFKDMGGIDETLHDLSRLLLHLLHPEVFVHLGVLPPRGFLLHGPPGCGKTMLVNAIAGELSLPLLTVAATELVSGVSGESEERVRDLFLQAKESSPCILFIDEVDAITPRRETAQREMERRIVSQLLSCIDSLENERVLLIGATNRPESLDPGLRRSGRFDREIKLGVPSEQGRKAILEVVTAKLTKSPSVDLSELSRLTPGYVGADLTALAREASLVAVDRVFTSLSASVGDGASSAQEALTGKTLATNPLNEEQLESLRIEREDFLKALKSVQPSATREGFATVPDVTWADVGALTGVRDELQLAILAPVQHAEAFEAFGVARPSGILLCGPPGCGKTLLAKAISNEAGINFISVKGPELLNMYVGESERAVRQVFSRARSSGPCVIFFDELDALCPRRDGGSGSGDSSARVVNQLLTEMDGLEARKGVFVLAASNRPDILDPAVLRPGRLDKVLFVDLPSATDRGDILRALTRNGRKPPLSADVNFQEIQEWSEGFTGADLQALVREAAVLALRESLNRPAARRDGAEKNALEVKREHFRSALAKVKPSIGEADKKRYAILRKRYSPSTLSSEVNDAAKGELSDGGRSSSPVIRKRSEV
ncbi:unnamed protein product [Cyprideis torosa]|uniref:Uncharacterized protein n=1 Tax=Cyprideis torosa TaxID=163714 RepID=A0A7R8W926_9CRUS|nr:unnamed protein product [Cyprideis torosa]CAG0884919.1 unnamed protein product [Cyprideis torosa]